MFDAKSLFEMMVRGAGPQQGATPGQPGAGRPMGGLDDFLRNLQPRQSGDTAARPAQGGGLDELLRKIAPGGAQGAGGLGDILGKLQQQMGSGKGGIADILGQVLGQATSGVREGAQRIDDATGASTRARDAVGQATGRSPDDLLQQLKELIANNQLGTGTALGGLGALILGTSTGRSMAANAAKIGALALIGGLAYKAYQNYSQGRPLIDGMPSSAPEAAPRGSGFDEHAVTNESATTFIRAMIAAANSDGRLDASEQRKIIGGLKQAGIDAEAEEFLASELNAPAAIDDLAAAVRSPEEAVQVYTAARVAIEPDTMQENDFLRRLAAKLGVDQKLAAHVDATARGVAA